MNTEIKLYLGLVAIIVAGVSIKGCAKLSGNKDLIDTEKNFNIAIESNDDVVSITNIVKYADYDGSQIQFTTQDGLVVLTSSQNTQLIHQYNENLVKEYAICLAGGNEECVYSYDELQNLDFVKEESGWNKNFFDLQYKYDYALIQSENSITIVEINKWRDYEDDKIQLILTNGTIILKDIKDVKLLDSSYVGLDGIYNYALSLIGDESKIQYYSSAKKLVK